MKNSIWLALAATSCLLASNLVNAQQQQDKLMMVFEITRHGARGGLNSEYFNQSYSPEWRPGELTSVGKRQHYLMGGEMRKRYMVKNKLMDVNQYRSSEIYIRSTNYNRTIESAMAQLVGLYSTGRSLATNQTAKALPKMQIR
jgi:lysosomal acid phosphatase